MSIEALIERHIEALEKNTATLERVIAGQQAALDKIEAPKTPRTTKKTEPAPAAAETPAAAPAADPAPAATETAATTAPAADVVTDEQLKAAALKWMDGKPQEARLEAAKKMNDILAYFGVGGKLTGPESKLDDDQRKQAKFFIERWAAGLTVDFSAEYDFDGDPTQGGAVDEDPLG